MLQPTNYKMQNVKNTHYTIRHTKCARHFTYYSIQINTITKYEIQNTSYPIQNTEYRIQNTNYKIQTTTFILPKTEDKLQNTKCELQHKKTLNSRY